MAKGEDNSISDSHWLNWCRLCGSKEDIQRNVKIYTNETENTQNSVVEMAIRKFFDVHMQGRDEPYGVLCETCYTFMIKLIDFAEHVTKVQAMFEVFRNTAEKPEIYESPNTKDQPEITPEKENINLLSAEEGSYPSSTAFDQTANNEISLSIDGNNVIIKSEEETQSCTAFDQTTNKEKSLQIERNNGIIKSEVETQIEFNEYSISEAVDFSSIDEDMTNTSSTVESEKHPPNTKDLPEIAPKEDNINFLSAEEVSYPSCTVFDQTPNKEISLSIDRNNEIIKSEVETQIEFNQYSISDAVDFSSLDEDMTNTSRTVEREKHFNGNDSYYCKLCNRTLDSKRNLRKHMERMHEKSMKCHVCGKQFTGKMKLSQHKAVHINEHPFSCKICNARFKTEVWLNKHHQIHVAPMKCDVCGKKFTEKTMLTKHKLMHSEEHSLSCKICNVRFTSATLLNRHHQIHEGSKLNCDVCGLQFTKMAMLTKHKLEHSEEHPLRCKICNVRFPSGTFLNRHHKKIHEKSKLKCNVCGQQFTEKAILRKHKLVHSKERHFTCTTCNAGFKSRWSLNRHLQIHFTPRKYKCTVCSYATNDATALRYHLLTHTNLRPSFNCKYCNKDFPYAHTVKRHKKKVHPKEYARDEDKSSGVSKIPTLHELRELGFKYHRDSWKTEAIE